MFDMDKVYKSKSYDEFRKRGEEHQKAQKMGDKEVGKDVKGTMGLPTEDFKQNSSIMKKTLDKMKYAPKTVSYAEFTKSKRNAKMQDMVSSGGNKDASAKGKMEDSKVAGIPKGGKSEKSFDIDVTKYKPKKLSSKA